MSAVSRWQHVRRITSYVLLMFVGFVMTWLVLLAKIRSAGDDRPTLVTEVEIHSLQARWGLDLLAVPAIAAVIALVRRSRREIGDVVIGLVVGLAAAVGMAYFPSAAMGGHIQWPLTSGYFDTSGYIDDSLAYAVALIALLVIVNRVAARIVSSPGTHAAATAAQLPNDARQ
jgi:hypothetical protein